MNLHLPFEDLRTKGVAVIPSLLNEQECQEIISGLWSDIETATSLFAIPVNRNYSNTWRSFYDLLPAHGMLLQHHQFGQSQTVWNVRQNPKIVQVFAQIWNVPESELLVSFDGISFHIPPEITNRGWYRDNGGWLHCDQSFQRNNFECIQSWVCGYDTNPGDATLTYLEGSHLYHGQFANERFGNLQAIPKSDWYKLNQEEINWYTQHGCIQKDVVCPKGSLVLWDSRTIHSGKESVRGRPQINLRAVVYLCYTPRSLITTSNLNKRIEAFQNRRTTNHYPHKPKLFPKLPRSYGAQMQEVAPLAPPILTPLGYRLVGY